MTTEQDFDLQELSQEAQNRWLKPPEIHFILRNHENYKLTEAPPQKPPGGSLFLFNKRVVRFFRKDGHDWRRKKSGRTVGEGHERLKVGNLEALNCYYAHGEENRNFQRRSYWMLDPAYADIVLVHYRDISERRQDAQSTSYLSPGYSTRSPSIYTVGNQGSVEGSSESINRMNHLDETGEFMSLSGAAGGHALQKLQERSSLSNGGLADTSPSCQESDNYIESKYSDYDRCTNQDETLVHGCEYRHIYETFDLYETNNLLHLPNSGEYTMLEKESSIWKDMQEQCPGSNTMLERESSIWKDMQEQHPSSIGSDPHDQNLKALDGTLPSSLEGVETHANLAAAQERWPSHWLDINGNDSENWKNCHQTFGSNDLITSPTTTSLHQVVENPKVSLYSSGTETNGAISNYFSMFDQENQFGGPLVMCSTSVPTQKHRFKIQEISPEWGFSNEFTKVVITGSFLCDRSKCRWTCMFGDSEVPVDIIQDGVLRCHAPPHVPGKVSLCIACGNREPCSQLREFEYRNCNLPQTDATRSTEELLLLVRFAEMVFGDPLVHKEDCTVPLTGLTRNPWEHIMEGLLFGNESSSSTMEWLVQEFLKDKLQQWLSSKYKKADASTCSMSKKEQGIIHTVAGLGFEWALCPILNSGVSVNFRDVNGWTALHWAARFGREKMVAGLIAAGASAGAVTDPTSQDPIGRTPGSIAEAHGHKGLAGYLSEVALTSHLSSLTLEETLSKESADVVAERTVDSITKGGVAITEDHLSFQDSLAAVRNAAQAAARIQAAFRAYSFRKRQLKESLDAICDEFGITLDDIRGLSFTSDLAFNLRKDPKLNKAALSIQKKYRGRKDRQAFLDLRRKIVMIQAHIRGHLERKRYKVIVWAVGILDKVVLRWRHGRVGLRGFRQLESAEEVDYEDVLKVFRKQKVNMAVSDALSKVLSMVKSSDAQRQYRRLLESYCQAKANLQGNTSGTASISPNNDDQMENDDWMQFLLTLDHNGN